MYDKESLSDAWNEGFEAGLDFAKTMIDEVRNSHQTVYAKIHDPSCLIYICTCESKDK